MDLEDDPNGNWIGFISSSLLLGAFCGCIPASLAADMLSRRTASELLLLFLPDLKPRSKSRKLTLTGMFSSFVVFIGALWFILGGVLQTAAMNRGMMLAGRFIGGFAIGQLSFLAPLYQTEIGKQCPLHVHRPELYT
jgi:MFS family permease